MNSIKKIFIATTIMILTGSITFGHYESELKEELVYIENFIKELLAINTQEAQILALYLEKVLKNEHPYERSLCIPMDEVLGVGSVLKSDIAFDAKTLEITQIKLKFEAKREKLRIIDCALTCLAVTSWIAYTATCFHRMYEGIGKGGERYKGWKESWKEWRSA